MAAYLGLDTLAVAGLAVAIALYEFYAQRNNTVTASNNNGGFEEMASEETYNDTISEKVITKRVKK